MNSTHSVRILHPGVCGWMCGWGGVRGTSPARRASLVTHLNAHEEMRTEQRCQGWLQIGQI